MFLSSIYIYPIKSLDGVSVSEARITAGGILENDRIYSIQDEAGKYVNGKRTDKIHPLRTRFDPTFQEVQIWVNDASKQTFSLDAPGPFNRWLSDYFGFEVHLVTESDKGFPDDTTAFGPTVVSEASLHEVAGWFPQLTLESVRRRFRSNLELSGPVPFWEDHLFGAPNELKSFCLGEVAFNGHNPCQRCAVPVRDPDRGDPIPNFQKTFMQLRKEKLPPWANEQRFNHYYRFAINTSIPTTEAGKTIRVYDEIHLES